MSLRGIVKGLLGAVILTFVFLLIISVVLYFSNLPETYLNIAVYIAVALSVIFGAILCAKISSSKVMINCLCMALLYLAVVALCTLLKNGHIMFNARFWIMCGGVVTCSALGAIVGR